MMLRALKVVGLAVGALVGVLAAVIIALAAFVTVRPLPLTALEPTLRSMVARAAPELEVSFEAPALRWNPGAREFELAISDLTIRDLEGKKLFHVAKAAVSPDIGGSLASGRLGIARLVLDRPSIALTRRADGSFGLRILDQQLVAAEPAGDDPWVAAADLLGRILAPPGPNDPLAGIQVLRAQDAQLLLEDQMRDERVELGGGTIEFRRRPGPAAIDARIGLGAGGTAGEIDMQIRRLAEPDRYRLYARLDHVAPARLPLVDTTPILRKADLVLDGSLEWTLTADGHPSPATFLLRSRTTTLTFPHDLPAPVPLGPVEIAGGVDLESRILEIDRLAGAVAGSELTATAQLSLGADGIAGDGDVTVGPIDLVRVRRLWPNGLAADARRWVEQHVADGSLGRLSAHLSLAAASGSRPLRYRVEASLDKLAVRGLVPGLSLTDGMLSLRAADGALTVSGRAVLPTGPLTLQELRMDFGGRGPPTMTARISGPVDLASLSKLGIEVPDFVAGTADLDMLMDLPGSGAVRASLKAGLRQTRITLPTLGIDKRAGQPGYIDADLIMDPTGALRVPVLDLSLPEGEAIGSLAFGGADRRLTRIDLRHLDLRGSLLRLTVAADGAGWAIDLSGQRLDLRPWMGENAADDGASSGGGWSLPALSLKVDVAEVALPGGWLHGLQGSVRRSATRWREGSITATLPEGTPVELTLTQAEARPPRLVLRTDAAGSLLGLVARGASFAPGGRFRLRTDILAESPALRLRGDLDIRRVTLRGAPLLARLLTLASFTGILNTLRGEGIYFDRIIADFALADGTLTLTDGKANGSQVGLTVAGSVGLDAGTLGLSGTVVPAYSINRLLGSVPIVGRLLRGESGIGAFAVTYSVRGPWANPSVSVNPLSVLVPGFIRDLFSDSGPVPAQP